jgi:hypothetical protein
MTILEILMWALPSGFASGAITFLVSRKTFTARKKKEREDVYRQLYDNLSATTLDLSKQIKKLNEKIIFYETAIRKIQTCKYVDRCPALIWMRQQQKGNYGSSPLGQPQHERNRANNLRAGPEADGDAVGECGTVDDPG